ncbi:hypothetical protein PG996_004905 [Apiospora saccharicola]|uniref:Uncharacterized protein n=1 Tax=Apiospora saccharicola TaxID=335842 RepID=A0ABR1VL08_9PEZI
MASEECQLRPQQSEPFLGYYESLSCFNDLVWQFCIWLLFITFFAVFTDFEQFQAISNAFPMPAFGLGFDAAGENIIMDDQSPVFNIFLLLFWIPFAGMVGGYILVYAILTFLLAGREERKGWKRLSERERELTASNAMQDGRRTQDACTT